MNRLMIMLVYFLLIGGLAIIAPAAAQEENTTDTNVTEDIPPEVAESERDWPLPNRDYANTRSTTDAAINASNVNTLDIDWAFNITAAGIFGGASSNPLIMGDTVYFQDLYADTYALDLEDGAVRWEQIYNNTTVTGPNGPAVGWGKVFVTGDPFSISALDAESGEELWATQLINTSAIAGNETTGEGIDLQPTVYGNLVYTSTVPGRGDVFYQGGAIGIIYALDQETGEIVWNFSTVDSPDLWGNPEVNSGGGVWYTPAVDTDTGVTYWGTGNPAPFAGTPEYPNGSSRPGPNLYTNTMLALDGMTGELDWFTQVLPHDLFDHDFQIPPILTSANISGEERDIALGAGKMGRVYAFDRENGAILWVTVVGRQENSQLAALPPGVNTTVYPGALGGVETPMAYADGIVYVPYVDLYTNWTPESSISIGVEGAIQAETQPFDQGRGGLVAIETDTGKILWEETFDSINVGGATVVNDLVFTATFDGEIYAFDRITGEQVWNYTAPAGINAWPAVANDTIVWPCGVGGTPQVIALRPGAAGENVTQPDNATPDDTIAPADNATGTPQVTIVSPEDNATLTAGNVTIEVDVTNFTLIEPTGQENVTGEGHLHYYMDAAIPTEPDEPAVLENASLYRVSANTSYAWENVTPGMHNFSVQLVNHDHSPVIPPVYQTRNVTVEEEDNVTENETREDNITANETGEATVEIAAQNLAFDTDTITVPAGAEVTMQFVNSDSGIPHNVAVYENSAATDEIFVGEIISTGEVTYTFTAPATPGTYYFQCDVHPQMNGDFVVE